MQLDPQESFAVVRQLADHTDTTTYYVRAVVRNSRTDTTLETVNLTDRGSGRFSNTYQVPADTSGLGFYISITTSVYTDSGYTTKSPNYGDEIQTYLIQRRVPPFGGGGGSGLTAREVRKIVQEELGKAIKEPEGVKPIDFKPVYAETKKIVENAVNSIEFPENDITPILRAVSLLEARILKIPTTHADRKDILDRFDEVLDSVSEINPHLKQEVNSVLEKVSEATKELDAAISELHRRTDNILSEIGKKEFSVSFGQIDSIPAVKTKVPNGFRRLMKK